jgi:hypothetical protein
MVECIIIGNDRVAVSPGLRVIESIIGVDVQYPCWTSMVGVFVNTSA